jgi:hypothetical protein
VEIKTLEQLQAVDPIVQRFTPLGLSMGLGILSPESAAEFVQKSVARYDLADDVPEDVRSNYERIRTIHSYGTLCYDLFTVADDQCFFLLDQALGARFISYYDGRIPIVVDGTEQIIEAAAFGALRPHLFGKGVKKPKDGSWYVASRSGKRPHPLSLSLRFLLRWAWDEGLLPGQRSRRIQDALANLRNYAAHWEGRHLVMPPDSARAIGQISEIINRLWGHDTVGGSLFRAPLEREPQIVSWHVEEKITSVHRPVHQVLRPEEAAWPSIVVLGVPHDEGLMRFDSQFERTVFPADYLFGPCPLRESFAWVAAQKDLGGAVTYLDRIFAVRSEGGEVDRVRSPAVMYGLAPEAREGLWHITRADHPVDAWSHAVAVARNGHSCELGSYCEDGGVTPLALGSWSEAVACALTHIPRLTASTPPEARVPSFGINWPV